MSVVFNVDLSRVEFPSESLKENSPYFAVSLCTLPPCPEYQITLPPWVTLDSLLSVLHYFETGLIEYADVFSALRVLWVVELFECAEMRDKLIERVISPQVERENVLLFLQQAYEKEAVGTWSLLRQKCGEIAEANADYLYQYYGKAMQRLPSSLVTSVIKGYFRLKGYKVAEDCSQLLICLLKASEYTHFLDLLASERASSLSPQSPPLLQTLPVPILPNEESTYSSPAFLLGSSRWNLSAVVSAVAGTLQVLLQRVGPEGAADRIEAVAVWGEVEGRGKSKGEMVIVSGKKRGENWLLVEIDIGEKDEDSTLIVNLWGGFAGLYSALLTHIGKSAQLLLLNEPLARLPSRDLAVLLQYRYLSVESEDIVLTVLAKWSSEAPFSPNLAQFLYYVRWTYVTTPTLITIFMYFPGLKSSIPWRNSLQREIEQRALGPRLSDEVPYKKAGKPRKCYSDRTVGQTYGQMTEFLREVEETLWTSGTFRSGFEGKFVGFMREREAKEAKVEQLREQMGKLTKNVPI